MAFPTRASLLFLAVLIVVDTACAQDVSESPEPSFTPVFPTLTPPTDSPVESPVSVISESPTVSEVFTPDPSESPDFNPVTPGPGTPGPETPSPDAETQSPSPSNSPSVSVSPTPSISLSPTPIVTPTSTPSVSATPSSAACLAAFSACDFTFAGLPALSTFALPAVPDVAFTSAIVFKKGKPSLGSVNVNGVVPDFILASGTARNITEFGTQPFAPSTFKTFNLQTGSGIGHQTFQGNQGNVVQDRCVRVWLSEYQVLDALGNVVRNVVVTGKSRRNCVVFRT